MCYLQLSVCSKMYHLLQGSRLSVLPLHSLQMVLTLAPALWFLAFCTTVRSNNSPSHFNGFSSDRYERLSRADPEQVMPLVIGLIPADFGKLEQELYRVSDPTHIAYGQYLTREHVDKLSQPADGALDAVHRWVGKYTLDGNIGTFSATSNLYKVPMKVKHVERLLRTHIYNYEAQPDSIPAQARRRLMRAATDVSVPEHLHDFVSFVNVNTHPLRLRARGAALSMATSPNVVAGGTLAVIRQRYGISDNLVVTNASNSQSVPSFYDEAYDPADLVKFFSQFLPNEGSPRIIEKGTRINRPELASTEASLDLQYITGVARNAKTYVWNMNGSNPFSSEDEPFVEYVQDVLEMEDPPLVVSISYSDDEELIFDVSAGYARTLDTLLIKMGLRGITVLVASGDDGVTGLRPELHKEPVEDMCKQSGPQWPSSSPYITTVGATMILPYIPEVAQMFFLTKEEVICSAELGGIITAGGGFSNVYALPEYQRTAVERYLKSRDIPTAPGFFNASGRAYPDVAALGANFLIYLKGRLASVSGTSASTPVLGAMVTLWNDLRLNAGKSPLGFLNPLFYYLAETHPDAFNDIIIGNNAAPRGGHTPCNDSFSAAAGWDAVSGVGTPNFSVIYKFIANLEDHFNISQSNKLKDSDSADVISDGITERHDSREMSIFTMMLLAASVLANISVGIVVMVKMVKRWRSQYIPLEDDNADKQFIHTDPGSTTNVTIQLESESDSSRGDNIELSEINLK
ncbi:putative peptidase S53, activation domain, Sedolisin domain, peptidase S8/S53 domain superfamily [Plasmopara halstedii]